MSALLVSIIAVAFILSSLTILAINITLIFVVSSLVVVVIAIAIQGQSPPPKKRSLGLQGSGRWLRRGRSDESWPVHLDGCQGIELPPTLL